jgi:endonuclease YncB( thermonuclease family)
MRRYRPAALLVLSLIFLSVHAETLTGRVVRVTDGDTIVVLDMDKVQHKIRLQGIDAPERGQAFGTKSKENLSDLVAGKSVVVDYSKYDRYQRILGKVLLNGKDVNLEQVEDGMAWHYKYYQREQTLTDRVEYSDAELEARRQKIGLWRDPNPVPPWDYRQAQRNQRKSMEPFVGKSTVRGSQ